MQPLISTKDSIILKKINQTEWTSRLSDFVEEKNHLNFNPANEIDHTYDIKFTDDRVLSHVSRFVVRKMVRFEKCSECFYKLLETNDTTSGRHTFTYKINRGNLTNASDGVFKLLNQLERLFLETLNEKQLRRSITFDVVNNLSRIGSLSFVGCKDHKKELTKKFIKNYFITRAKFMCTRQNKIRDQQRKLARCKRKMAKLVRAKESEIDKEIISLEISSTQKKNGKAQKKK